MDSATALPRALRLLIPLLALLLVTSPAPAAVTAVIQEPYVDLRTGPGRGYPPVFALARGEEVSVIERQRDWYQLRNVRGRQGWAHRKDIQQTLDAAGVDPDRRDAFVDRYLSERLQVGLTGGSFDGDPLVGLYALYRIRPQWLAELRLAQSAGTFSGSQLYHLWALFRPAPELPVTPHLSLGAGYFENAPRQTLVESREADGFGFSVGLGASYRFRAHLVLRADWRYHRADLSGHDEEFQEITAGLALAF